MTAFSRLTMPLSPAMMDQVGMRARVRDFACEKSDVLMSKPDQIAKTTSPGKALAHDLVDRIDDLLQRAAASGQPIEIDPHRSWLFELFVMSEATGFLEEGADEDLSCDGVARNLANRWNLARNLGGGLSQAASLPREQLSRLRLLWSFMRMWMEWTYAWQRWDEFHKPSSPSHKPVQR